MTKQYTIRCTGFEPKQQATISAILDLAESALTSIWLIIDSTDSDVLMVNMDSPTGKDFFSAEKANRPSYRFILVTEFTTNSELDLYWILTQNGDAPPSLKELAKLLNDVAEVLNQEEKMVLAQSSEEIALVDLSVDKKVDPEPVLTKSVEANAVEPKYTITPENLLASSGLETETNKQNPNLVVLPKTTPPLSRPLYAKNYLFGILVQARKDKACRTIKHNKLPTLYLSPSDDCYYFWGSAADILTYCTAMPQYLEEATITKSKLTKMLRNGLLGSSQPLDNLIAYSIIEASQGRLLGSHSADQSVIMTQMPSAGIINLLANFKDIAQFMYKQPRTLFQVAEALRVPLSTIFEFYNVCFLLGYLNFESPTPKTEPEVVFEDKKSGKLGHFLKTFFNK